MKAKIFLIIMMILFAVSCANNNPANPVQNNNETKNTENNANSGNTSSNSGNTSSNNNGGTEINNYGDKISIDSLDGIVEYGGKGQLNIKLLDGIHAVGPEDIQVYVDIYEEDKIASVHARGLFNFDNIKLDNNGQYIFKHIQVVVFLIIAAFDYIKHNVYLDIAVIQFDYVVDVVFKGRYLPGQIYIYAGTIFIHLLQEKQMNDMLCCVALVYGGSFQGAGNGVHRKR